ncbi:MAG: metallophosphoesterase family protein [Deltaproteobacteria bacterium]|nr:metallophosphoesterase family protein [Deltaproteobacteria bacterium]
MLAIISDIHANIEALTSVYRWLDQNRVDEVLCLGDVVGYGADPNAVCELVRQRCKVCLLGNHDAAVIGAMATDYYQPPAKEAIYWTRTQLTEDNFRWLYALPFTHVRDDAAYYHAAPFKPSGWYYVVRQQDAQHHNTSIYQRLKRWNFVGHSHLTLAYAINGKKTKDVTGEELSGKDDRKYLVNVGSVGQPRDRDPRLCFGLYDPDFDTFRHVRLPYDVESTARKIVDAGLDAKFAKRLFVGQ